MKKYRGCLLILALCVLLSGCDTPGYTKTEQTEKAIADYISAVQAVENTKTGEISISIRCNDTVINKSDVTETYLYKYTVDGEGAERFNYICYNADGSLQNEIKTTEDGSVINALSGEPEKGYDTYLDHSKNPISSLQLFRMDANYKLRHSTISSITGESSDGKTVITVIFDGNKLTDLSIKNTKGIRRRIVEHKRVYTITDGKISSISIYDMEHAQSGQETGTIETTTEVEIKA